MVGTLCFAYPTNLRSTRGLKRLRGVDVEESALAIDRNFGDRLSVLGDEVTGADVAIERHQLLEEAARPQHRIAAAAVADGDGDQMAAVRRKGLDQLVDQFCRDQRH